MNNLAQSNRFPLWIKLYLNQAYANFSESILELCQIVFYAVQEEQEEQEDQEEQKEREEQEENILRGKSPDVSRDNSSDMSFNKEKL